VPDPGSQRRDPGAGDGAALFLRHQDGRADDRRSAHGAVPAHPDAGPGLLRPYADGRGAVAPDHGHPVGGYAADHFDQLCAAQLPDPDRRGDPAVLRQSEADRVCAVDRA
ncbi:hypothetical protein LTR94_035977, partial [Friedmanniomyces endolithicus]